MFKMNPAAKEFVPAHILKKRQEEEARLGELTQQLDKVDINKSTDNKENGVSKGSTSSGGGGDQGKRTQEGAKEVQEDSSSTTNQATNSSQQKQDTNLNKQTSSICTNQQQSDTTATEEIQNSNNQHANNNNNHDSEYPEGLQELIEGDEDDRYLLNDGENLCEFNGEQYIIPGDDEFEHPQNAGYDFGNVEDNEDQDVCNAFEEFLDNLPGH